MRKNTAHPEEAWTPKERGDFRHHSCWFQDLSRELCSCSECMCEHFCGAKGTELLQCQGHRTFKVTGPQVNHTATTTVLDAIRSDKSFIFCHDPTLNQSWGIITLIISSSWLKCNYFNTFCTFKGFISFKVLHSIFSHF